MHVLLMLFGKQFYVSNYEVGDKRWKKIMSAPWFYHMMIKTSVIDIDVELFIVDIWLTEHVSFFNVESLRKKRVVTKVCSSVF